MSLLKRITDYVNKPVDRAPLALFRMFYGFLIACEGWGAIMTGWVRRTLVEPGELFTFIGFEFLEHLGGPLMYPYFVVMGATGIAIMLGWRYRLTSVLFALMWSAAYLMQKASYNNHYYLLMLLAWMMALLPAHRSHSLDVRSGRSSRRDHMPAGVRVLIIVQLLIVYTYASLAKLYPDWLDNTFSRMLMSGRADYPIIGSFLQQDWVHTGISWFGILFDGLVIPALLWKPTRKWAFGLAVFFHLFNSVTLGIGIFPFLALAFTVFFFDERDIRRIFFRSTLPERIRSGDFRFTLRPLVLWAGGLYLLIQLLLPLRHYLWEGNVFWTEEGHRLSWRMMLRFRTGYANYTAVFKDEGTRIPLDPRDFGLNAKQLRKVQAHPDFIWQFAQKVHRHYEAEGKDVEVYVQCRVRLNDHALQDLIDPQTDLASVPWNHWTRNEWVLIQDPYFDGPKRVIMPAEEAQ